MTAHNTREWNPEFRGERAARQLSELFSTDCGGFKVQKGPNACTLLIDCLYLHKECMLIIAGKDWSSIVSARITSATEAHDGWVIYGHAKWHSAHETEGEFQAYYNPSTRSGVGRLLTGARSELGRLEAELDEHRSKIPNHGTEYFDKLEELQARVEEKKRGLGLESPTVGQQLGKALAHRLLFPSA